MNCTVYITSKICNLIDRNDPLNLMYLLMQYIIIIKLYLQYLSVWMVYSSLVSKPYGSI